MARFNGSLDRVHVAAPCPADWNQMVGSERVRFCDQCNLNVYNLSGMSKTAAEALLASTEDRLCIRYYRRADGTILTRNCPIGLQAIKRKVKRTAGAALSALLSFCTGLGLYGAVSRQGAQRPIMMGTATTVEEPEAIADPTPIAEPEIGKMAVMGQAVLPVNERIHGNKVLHPIRRQQIYHQ